MNKILLTLLFCALPALAGPVASVSVQDVTVTLFDDACAIPYVTNLPMRATWVQGDKTFEGCFAVFPESAAIGMWFDDGSVAVVPAGVFRPVTGL